ncbi:hypothetical protein [Oleiharenicola lentus]|uniref:hypothetical protein n=1 Tax=Oleiharenicola lentus TaxID=2508720 RepID=UPI003F67B006
MSAILVNGPSTVHSRRRNIMEKLDIHSTHELIRYAITHGLTQAEQFIFSDRNWSFQGFSPEIFH